MTGRVVIDSVRPSTPARFPAKAVVGESVRVCADVFRDGHDRLAARVRWRPAGGKWSEADLHETKNDLWEGTVRFNKTGPHEFVVEAWTDLYATWRHKVTTKLAAGQEIDLDLEEGARLLEARRPRGRGELAQMFDAAVAALRDKDSGAPERLTGQIQLGLEALAGRGDGHGRRGHAVHSSGSGPSPAAGAWSSPCPRPKPVPWTPC